MSRSRNGFLFFSLALGLSAQGCPESSTDVPVKDATLTSDSDGSDGADGGDSNDDDVAAPDDTGDDDVAEDDAAEPDITQVDTEKPPVDTSKPPECVVDDDCLAVLGPTLTNCELPICEEGKCTPDGKADGSACDDGDVCTESDRCFKGQCAGSAITCDDAEICTADECDPFNGSCSNAPLTGDSCDDGDLCSGPDVCTDGACTTTPGICPACEKAADCAAVDDNNACNGTVGCVDGTCALAPGSIVDCSNVLVGACDAAVCDPVLGACTLIAKSDGTQCTSSSKCVSAGVCLAGKCVGPELECDDQNPCTQDICDTGSGCIGKAIPGNCDDNNACTKDDSCSNGACVGQALVSCDDNNVCTSDACDPVAKTCSYTPVDAGCDDGNQCTSGDACSGGACLAAPKVCDDKNNCTTDACDATAGCVYTPTTCPDDGSACTVISCDPTDGKCSTTFVNCDDQNACTIEDCDPTFGCKSTNIDCTDTDPCTTESCDKAVGCVIDGPNATCKTDGDCADADPCTIESCTGACGTCEVAPFPCFDGDTCTKDSCVPGQGCKFTASTGDLCDDGDACTGGETCFQGACTGGLIVCELGTFENPSPSCLSIRQAHPSKTTGKYWLRVPSNPTPFEAWCDMATNTGGAIGGFTRIGVIAGEIPLCAIAQGFGTVAGVATAGTTTAIWPSDLVAEIPFLYREILVVLDTGFYVFSSGNGQFNWTAVANGTINSSNLATFQVEGSKNGAKSELIQSIAVPAAQKGPALLGGKIAAGFTPFLGVGAQRTGKFLADAACAATVNHSGIFRGIFTPALWGGKGSVYIR